MNKISCSDENCSGFLLQVSDTTNILICDTCQTYHYMRISFEKVSEENALKIPIELKDIRKNNKNKGQDEDCELLTYQEDSGEGKHKEEDKQDS